MTYERPDAPYPEPKKTHTMARTGRPWTDRKPPAAAPVWAVIEGFGRFHVLVSAIELGVFDDLARSGPSTPAEIAARIGASPTHLGILLDGVVALGLLEQRFDRFELNDTARRYLTSDGAATMAALVPVAPGPLENWVRLTDTVRDGAPATPVDDDPTTFYVPLVEATFPTIMRCAVRSDLQLRWSALDRPRVLELGAGGAPWSIAVLTTNPGATAVANDLAGVIDVAARKVAEHGVADRVELRPGDFHAIDLEDEAYDVVVLGHVLRAEGRDRARSLVARAARAVRPGGRLLVSDYFVDRQRTANQHAVMMGVTMMASTRSGATVTYDDHAAWLRDAGLAELRLIEPIGFQQVLVARKPVHQRGATS